MTSIINILHAPDDRLCRPTDAPPTDERVATRGRSATGDGDERVGVKRAPIRSRLNFMTVGGGRTVRADRISVSRPHGAGSAVTGNDALPIDESAARSGRGAMEGGDGVEEGQPLLVPASLPHRNARGERRDQGRARASVHPSAYVARRDTPLIGDRAATCGRGASEGGDERASAKRI
jgi:hypothetical protein